MPAEPVLAVCGGAAKAFCSMSAPAFSRFFRPFAVACFLLAAWPSPLHSQAPVSQTSESNLLAASDARYLFEGRFDKSDPAQPVIVWAGDRVSLEFTGGTLALRFGAAVDQNFFNLTVDGVTEIVSVPAGPEFRYAWPHALGSGYHRMELFKRSEAAAGHVTFRGVEIADPAGARAPKPPPYQLKIQFIGDSITAGACNEDGANDQWEDRRTHNHALSYDCLTSQALHADHRAMAVSGMGIVTGYVEVKAAQVWDKIYPRPDSSTADLAAWKPDLVFINLGENDDSFTRGHQLPFPDGYTSGYVALVKAIRAGWPQARIILLRGGMYGGAKSVEFRAAWESAVHQLESGDNAISHYVFTHWSMNHPRVSDDRAMADELVTWLKQQPFMAPFLKK
jgi:lysophospholipase L1-like esterase